MVSVPIAVYNLHEKYVRESIFSCSSVLAKGVHINPASVKQSLLRSAKKLPNFNIFEQGI